MNIKKINAILTTTILVLTIVHVLEYFLLTFGFIHFMSIMSIFNILLVVLFFIHILLSIYLLIFKNEHSNKAYFKENISTIIQRFCGILMLVTIFIHGKDVPNFRSNQSQISLIGELLFCIFVFIHLYISTDKVLVSLGLYKKKLTLVNKIIIVIIGLISVVMLIYLKYMY